MDDPNEEFFAVALSWEESDKLVHIELQLSTAAEKVLAAGTKPTILACDELEQTIVGFESFSRVFFLNLAAWVACKDAGLALRSTRKVRRSEIPANYVVLAGPSSSGGG